MSNFSDLLGNRPYKECLGRCWVVPRGEAAEERHPGPEEPAC